MALRGLGGRQSGRSNGLNADGSLMNVGNKLGERPSIRLFTQYSSSSQMEQALSDDWIYGKEAEGVVPSQLAGETPGQKRRALPSGVGLVGGGGQPQRWRTRPQAVEAKGDEADWEMGDGSTGLTPRAQHMALAAQPLVHGPGLHHRVPSQGAVVAHHAAARRQTEQVAAANQLIVQQNLWHAIRAGKRQMVRRAVEDDGGDPMAGNPDEAGITAVHLAAKLSKIGLLEYLLSLPGVDPQVKDSRGRTPADLATNADIRDLLAGHHEEQLHRPPPPPGAPSWGRSKPTAAPVAASSTAPRREAAATAAEARVGGEAAKPWPRRTRHNEDDPINPREVDVGDDDDLSVAVPGAAARLADAPATPVKLLGERASSVFNALDRAGPVAAAASSGAPAGDLEPTGGVVAAAAKTAAAAKGKAARGSGGSRGPVTKDVFVDGSNRGSGSSDTSTSGVGAGAGARQLDADGFPVIEGPPQASAGAPAELGQDDFLR